MRTYNVNVFLRSTGTAAGSMEGEGPLARYFDVVSPDGYFGEKTWEKAESKFMTTAAQYALNKAGLTDADIDAALAGDLLNQCITTGYTARDMHTPLIGLYGACSTMALSMALGSLLVTAGMRHVLAGTSSHFASAERQFRTPMEYGAQRPPTAQWTATGSGMVVLSSEAVVEAEAAVEATPILIKHVTFGRVIDRGVDDVANMGAAMAPAAVDTLDAHLHNVGSKVGDYDGIFTGDLGNVGYDIACDLGAALDHDLSQNYQDCGQLLYAPDADVGAGASGCGCGALVFCGYIYNAMRTGQLKRVLFIATGALMSPVSIGQGESIPSIAHAVEFVANA